MNNITYYNRIKKILEAETVFTGKFKNIFYGTVLGRFFLNIFFKRKIFTVIYCLLQNRRTKRIHEFIDKYNINMTEFEKPATAYKTFNDFFIRKFKPGSRPIIRDSHILISPVDSRMQVFSIRDYMQITVKGKKYAYNTLIHNREILKDFENGVCLIFRLVPYDYHRFCYIDEGTHGKINKIKGNYHVSGPQVLVKNHFPIYHDNYREYCILKTKNFGEVVQIEVGAMTVGKITQYKKEGGSFMKGEEKGYFEYGGSTIILLFKPGTVRIDDEIMEYSKREIETLVQYGSGIGRKI